MAAVLEPEFKTAIRRQPPYNVILMNDDFHTVEYVVEMMQEIFKYPPPKGIQVAKAVHEEGFCVVWTGAMEIAELKQEQIHEYGADRRIPECKGSMTAEIEPAVV